MNGSVYTFHLRQGVMSDAGNEMTAADVHWSLEKAMAAGTTGAFWLLVAGLTSIDQVEIIDDYTIRISGLVGDSCCPRWGQAGWRSTTPCTCRRTTPPTRTPTPTSGSTRTWQASGRTACWSSDPAATR